MGYQGSDCQRQAPRGEYRRGAKSPLDAIMALFSMVPMSVDHAAGKWTLGVMALWSAGCMVPEPAIEGKVCGGSSVCPAPYLCQLEEDEVRRCRLGLWNEDFESLPIQSWTVGLPYGRWKVLPDASGTVSVDLD